MKITHSGFFSYLKASDTLADNYATTVDNEVILFTNGNTQLFLNSLLVENCNTAVLYVKPINSDFVLCVPAGESRELYSVVPEYLTITGIQVLGSAGQKLRYSGCYYDVNEVR